ncbi:MAG: HTH-type transcriptional regulator CymR [Chroococcidiopsis cubana SAG 39.79]|jgi:Rrf2 family transcriptional regulator, cysteine metabolism repressor|uniref:Transcriptional regulator, BadM/Rrf2 family n=2 Tax=Chroococcidiopsis TaxID=54298 RepID=K9TVH5_CHRTP|nr:MULTISPECIES: Rrf2 family transcriptional regulator [Chroococcidiopsis]AFY86388.1 transcriptional regulator, BadM/Rrf2 family [Chroococcidiopsis thermalis PCC 7203]MDZ4876666.1 HTH-type transcriptional regulator CymR [Chroococcidiopsis cubana SAG 39.79]PSB62201.1 Rrf2 family transcriptional regulator [Chroococcidiopsis cubana CCALA 043]RUT04092.1 Rrf2 family transcriptional regulator [Chroococcidiopsis cubana SAG 39.79]URD51248.1 Rrf2 family transcriptional regulator [Chroococcidiopsis sp. 
MELSSKSEYALLALLELANAYQSAQLLQIRQIAARRDIPERYLDQLLAILRRGGLIKGIRGAKGGYILAREPSQITLLDALRCIEGLDIVPSVEKTTSEEAERGAIEEIWYNAEQAANAVWQNYTLQDLCDRVAARRQLDYMYYI